MHRARVSWPLARVQHLTAGAQCCWLQACCIRRWQAWRVLLVSALLAAGVHAFLPQPPPQCSYARYGRKTQTHSLQLAAWGCMNMNINGCKNTQQLYSSTAAQPPIGREPLRRLGHILELCPCISDVNGVSTCVRPTTARTIRHSTKSEWRRARCMSTLRLHEKRVLRMETWVVQNLQSAWKRVERKMFACRCAASVGPALPSPQPSPGAPRKWRAPTPTATNA